MALQAGSVTVDGSGQASGSGWAKEFYDNYAPKVLPAGAPASAAQQVADLANSLAATLFPHFTDNAQVTVSVTPSDAGLQRLPEVLAADQPTKAPSTTKTLTGTLT